MTLEPDKRGKTAALELLSSTRPRNVSWLQAAGLLFGDWGTSRLYVLGLAFFFARRTSFYLILLMSVLIMAVGWAYTQISRIYPDGGGVYTAAKHRSRTLAVIGALLLFADYTVTASLSVLDAFHYFGLPNVHTFLTWYSPGLWAIITICAIGFFNLFGPKHTGGVALAAAVGMVILTLLITIGALPQLPWKQLPRDLAVPSQPVSQLWVQFVSIILALSGVEAIANLTGVMKRPVAHTARRAIWTVATEVAVFNALLALCMVAIPHLSTSAHRDDMMAFLAGSYLGDWAELAVRAVGGVLLLSAGNTAITDMISVQYLMARDGELPAVLQKLNRYGVPWIPAALAAGVPSLILFINPDVEQLSHLYAIGLIGAVSINVTLCALHPRLRRLRRKGPMLVLGVFLLIIWITLAATKHQALLFVTIVLIVGLSARQFTRWLAARRGKPSLIRQAIAEQLTPEALDKRKIMVGTYGSEMLAPAALAIAKAEDMALVVCFIRRISLSIKWEMPLSIDTDVGSQRTFARFLALGSEAGVPIIPVYDTGPDPAVLMAEAAAVNGCERVLIGSSRQGMLHYVIKGSFQRRLESLLPPEIPVQVINPEVEPPTTETTAPTPTPRR